jgi:hypothetical protein
MQGVPYGYWLAAWFHNNKEGDTGLRDFYHWYLLYRTGRVRYMV